MLDWKYQYELIFRKKNWKNQILVSKYQKESGLFGEMVDSRVGAGKIQDEPGASCGTRKLEYAIFFLKERAGR